MSFFNFPAELGASRSSPHLATRPYNSRIPHRFLLQLFQQDFSHESLEHVVCGCGRHETFVCAQTVNCSGESILFALLGVVVRSTDLRLEVVEPVVFPVKPSPAVVICIWDFCECSCQNVKMQFQGKCHCKGIILRSRKRFPSPSSSTSRKLTEGLLPPLSVVVCHSKLVLPHDIRTSICIVLPPTPASIDSWNGGRFRALPSCKQGTTGSRSLGHLELLNDARAV